MCQPGTSGSACGAGGAACATCSGTQLCSAGNCSGGGLTGDGCDTAPLLTLPFSVSHSLVGDANDFTSGSTSCRGTQGIDRAVRVNVPVGMRLTVTVTPTTSTFDPTLSLVTGQATACLGSTAMCVAAADTGNANAAETVAWTNTTGTSATVYIIVDDYSPTGTNGTYSLSGSVAVPAAGESCGSPLNAVSGVSVSRAPSAFTDDYQGTGTGCLTPSTGPDFVVAYTVPNNRSLTVTATPVSGLDVSLNFATSVSACGARVCVASSSSGGTGVGETIGWNNTTGATVTVFAIVDTAGSPVGTVSVLGTEGAILGCGATTCPNGCCSAGACVAGTGSLACGTGGVTCASCTSPAQCNTSQVCSATELPTGSMCTAAPQCYQPILGTAECRTSWPGGYCTGTCLLTNQVCTPPQFTQCAWLRGSKSAARVAKGRDDPPNHDNTVAELSNSVVTFGRAAGAAHRFTIAKPSHHVTRAPCREAWPDGAWREIQSSPPLKSRLGRRVPSRRAERSRARACR